jgi:hypothetical protein
LAENRELAYRTWRACGQNIEMTAKKLRDMPDGFPVTRPTLMEWRDKYDWIARAARAEAEEQKATDAVVSAEGKALAALEKVQQNYEDYFEALGKAKVDNQAMYAYTGVVKAIMEIKAKTAAYKAALFLEFLRDLVEWFSKNDPPAVEIIERNFDDLAAWAKEKHAG